MIPNDGGSAYPFTERNSDGTHYHSHPGMSLRVWLAGSETLSDLAGDGDYSVQAAQALAGKMPDVKADPVGHMRWNAKYRAKMRLLRADAVIDELAVFEQAAPATTNRAAAALRQLLDVIEYPPEPNCSCHLSPPCRNCEYKELRDAIANAEFVLGGDK